ncbi:MAG: repressor LexA, partial [Deltaproteobacteria bacterium]|nr:repressor LexA [Deltaproteobacteria bacterium]
MLLTKQQTRIYRYLETYLRRHGRPPSYQEIREHFNFRSLNSVAKHLKQLERKGYLESPWANQKRAFRLLPLRTTAAAVPFLGRVAAGAPLEAVEIPETMEVPE